MNLELLSTVINELKSKALSLDRHGEKTHQRVFDSSLFRNHSYKLHPYVEELEQSLSELIVHCGFDTNPTKTDYLSERLINQLSAIQREINNQTASRSNEPQLSTHQLHQDLAQHIEWEYRLQTMLLEKTHQLELSLDEDASIIKQAVNTLEQRLFRCQVAKQTLQNRLDRQKRRNSE
ncbi:primosomal replication protein PriC [Vibrio sp. RC27]